ncbi:hypothetical protein LEP1GSC047_0206 [Leptospira inadai serovar Lyme str. 10]|uniref:Uncharacterized protein n=4 Tax=Leptospira inadai TaxID=29506 RepID=V6HEQ2_9LEPT|nr:hypothetical protein LEP1GSC047_0206 [Leptospira inadai serovar Lyme str. 10]PNV72104.1 hypothetical protein BES34_019945 [Leptospira inadai serovar Lyme]
MYFGALPIAAVSILPQSHLRVLVAISSYQGTLEFWTGGIDKILVRVNGFEIKGGKKPRELKYRRVSQIIRDLKTWGWLEVERSGFSRPNSYSIRIPENLIIRPEHSYTVSLSSEERETEKKPPQKSESVSRSQSANMNRVSRNATLYKEPSKESRKELTQAKKEKQVPRPAPLAFIPPLSDALARFKERIRKTGVSPSTLESILAAASIEELNEHHKRYFDSFYFKEYGFLPCDRFGADLSKAAV